MNQALGHSARRLAAIPVANLFAAEPDRAAQFRLSGAGLTLDYAKQRLDQTARQELIALASEQQLASKISALTTGFEANITEARPALHTLLRGTRSESLPEYYSEVRRTLQAMHHLVEAVHDGQRRGFTGERFTDVVNIGIGGSDLGPRMVCGALASPQSAINAHFVANVDPEDLDGTLAALTPARTLFVVCSKSFTTEETLTNALRARQWLLNSGADAADIAQHFVAVTTNLEAANDFGINRDHCYPMWDWVGGRYSLWSAVGLVIALNLGWSTFEALLEGGRAMDEHALTAETADNLPMMLALLEHWNTLFMGTDTHVVLPYAQRLAELPDFLQQLTMESNGKRVTVSGDALEHPSAPVLWGSAGTIGQHSYYQLLHQGNRAFSADIILPLKQRDTDLDAHRKLVANALAQSRAFMVGRGISASRTMAEDRGYPAELAPHLEIPGNHPHSLITFEAVSPHTVGALVAAYEHKTFFLSQLWNINAFDQWGVELGKEIGRQIHDTLKSGEGMAGLDAATAAVVAEWRRINGAD